MAYWNKILFTNAKFNITAIIICCAINVIPIVLLYVLLGEIFWKVLLLIGCCFISIPFFAIYGIARAGTPVSPNQFLSGILRMMRGEIRRVEEPKIITTITLLDIIKGVIFSILLVALYHFVF